MKKLLSILLLLSCYLTIFSQDKTERQKLVEFVGKINSFNHLYPQEKVYMHFDNTSYFKGETIWFKAYVVMAENNVLSPLSKVLYAELLTPEGEIVETKKLKIENGQANGNFILEDNLYAGYYEVRAYTRCMLNFDEQIVFSRVFPVYDMPKQTGDYSLKKMSVRGKNLQRKNLRKEEKSKDLNLAFFPEGGNLVAGIANRIAFKATDKEGKAVDITGSIYNCQDEEVTAFTALHLGMGSFILYPDNNKYIAEISHEGKKYKFDLPGSKPSGYAMQVENLHPETISVQVEKAVNQPEQMLGITFSCRGKVYAFEVFEPNSVGQYTLRLSKENLPSGVVQITLFTSRGEVLAQRQAFINNNIWAIPVKITNTQASFEPFSPISIDFEVKDINNHPVETTFSLSVRDEITTEKTNYTDNILYNLLLSSELKGYIENPAYYFEADDNQHRMALDLLMLVQGWTRYSWKQAAGVDPFMVKYGIEKNLIIEGRVLSPGNAKPQEGIEVSMWMASKYGSSQQGKCTTDKEGKFNFGLEDITGVFDLNLQAKKKGKPYISRMPLDRSFSPVSSAFHYYETHPEEVIEEIIKTGKKEVPALGKPLETKIQMGEIDSPERRFNQTPEKVAMSAILPEVEIKGEIPARRTMLQRLLPYAIEHHNVIREIEKLKDEGESQTGSILDLLISIDPYFSYTETPMTMAGGIYHEVKVRYRGYEVPLLVDGKPIINEIPYTEFSYDINDLSIDEIEHIVITTSGDLGYEINIILNENGAVRRERKGSRKTYYEGFALKMEFYSPDYSIASLPEPDVRRTLYWNPDVKTDNQGHASVHFYNNETCKNLSISAEGLSPEGIIILTKESKE